VHLLRRLLLSAALVLPLTAAGVQDDLTAQEVVSAVETTYKEIDTLQADFVQISRSVAMGELRQEGRVQVKRPRKMRWDFHKPSKSAFVTDGTQMWVWSAESNQVILSQELADSSGQLQLLDDLSKLGELFEVQLEGSNDTTYTLALTPKTPASFKKLRLVFARKGMILERLVMVDSFDGEVELLFSSLQLSQEIPDGQFVFQIPEGAEVINSSGL